MPSASTISAQEHPAFKAVLQIMMQNQFYIEIGQPHAIVAFSDEELRFAVWLASIIADSETDDDRGIASIFAIMLYLQNKGNLELEKAAFLILSRAGNLIAARFINSLFSYSRTGEIEFSQRFSPILDMEIGSKTSINSLPINGTNYLLSDYQRLLWKALRRTEESQAISAPTSAGKSFIIQNYIVTQFLENTDYWAVYIVPSRALIAQVSTSFMQELPNDVEIKTAFIEDEDPETDSVGNRSLYVLTPERCLRMVFYSLERRKTPNLLFFDEIQNVEKTDGRGFFLEYLINSIISAWSGSRIITAGPFIASPDQLFAKTFTHSAYSQETQFSPVLQLRTTVLPADEPGKILVRINFRGKNIADILLDSPFDLSTIFRSGTKREALIEVTKLLGRSGHNVIYVPRSDYAEQYANDLSLILDEDQSISREVRDLIELVNNEIHQDYYLSQTLRKGIAFHHGGLPEMIRGEIEYLFQEKKIRTISCTSTLMEGVNLPADKVFLIQPKKDTTPLTNFEFGNIIGRAGRIGESLVGMVVCVQDREDSWAEEYYENEPQTEIEPAITKVLSRPLDEVIKAIQKPLEEPDRDLFPAICFLKHKFLRGDQTLIDYLNRKDIVPEKTEIILRVLETRLKDVLIPLEVLRLNPTIDPELQDKLYRRIVSEGIQEWVIHEGPHLNRRMNRAQLDSLQHLKKNLYGQLEDILLALDSVFDFNTEVFFGQRISRTVKQMILYATKWIQGNTLKQLINGELNWEANIRESIDLSNKTQVNSKIKEVIKIYNNVVTFTLVKYLKLLTDILNVVISEEDKDSFKTTFALPTMLELGTRNPVVLKLIAGGISRTAALKIAPLVPEEFEDAPLEWLKIQSDLDVPLVYRRYLQRKQLLLST